MNEAELKTELDDWLGRFGTFARIDTIYWQTSAVLDKNTALDDGVMVFRWYLERRACLYERGNSTDVR